jgi:hypothetical protein
VPVFNAKTQALTDQRRVVMDQNFYKMSTVCVCGVMVAHGMIERERERERESLTVHTAAGSRDVSSSRTRFCRPLDLGSFVRFDTFAQ